MRSTLAAEIIGIMDFDSLTKVAQIKFSYTCPFSNTLPLHVDRLMRRNFGPDDENTVMRQLTYLLNFLCES